MNPPEATCRTCGRPVAAEALDGFCAACMWGAFTDNEESPGGGFRLRIRGHEVMGEIARGGMGIVYRARQLTPPRDVALKMLLPHQLAASGMAERFRQEARALADLEHPNILPIYQLGEHDGIPYFTMKLAMGGTLAQRTAEFAGSWRAIAELVATLAEAVQFAHERGVLHRDLKPGNVLFDEAGRAYVSDFGLAKLAGTESNLTRSVEFLGTPHYVAPEVAARSAREATTASDIYSLGAILYELIAGRPPFEAEGVPALLKKIAEDEPTFPSKALAQIQSAKLRKQPLPRELEIICRKCLAKDPARRYATADDLAEDLRRWLGGRTILARPATPLERAQSWARRNPALATLLGVLISVLMAAVIFEARSNRRLQQALAGSLLRQAQLERSSRRAGQRFETLALVSRAAEQLRISGSRLSHSNLVALRSEVAAALALPDLRATARWRVHVANLDNEFDFTANLDRYAALTPDGGFQVVLTTNQIPVYRVAGDTNNPVIKLRLHPRGSWVAARFRDGHAELHALTNAGGTSSASPHFATEVEGPRNSSFQRVYRWRGVRNAGALFDFSPAGDSFAVVVPVSREERLTEIIDLNTGVTNARVPPASAMTLTFGPTGRLLALAGTELVVWRLGDTKKLWSMPLSHDASALTWSDRGDRLAVALDRRRPIAQGRLLKACPVLIFNAATGQEESVFGEFHSRVSRLAFHPNSEWLAAATWDDGLVFGGMEWNSGRLTSESAHRALKFAADGSRLACAPTREDLGLFEVATPSVFRAWPSVAKAEEAFTMAVSGDGKWIVTASDSSVRLWDALTRTEIDSHPLPVKAFWVEVLFGATNGCVYYSAASFGVRRVMLTNPPGGRLRFGGEQIIGESGALMAVGFSHDKRSLLVGEHRGSGAGGTSGPTMWLWPDADPKRGRKLAANFSMTGYRVVPQSRWAFTTSIVQPDVWIWDFENGERVRSLGLTGRASSEATVNGRWLVARTRDEFGVWEVGTWKRLSRWLARADEASMNLFSSPDSRFVATHDAGGRFVLRELPDGAEVILLTPPHSISVQHHQFSPDSTRLLFMSNNGQMFDWDLSKIRRELAKLKLDWKDNSRE